MGAKEQTFVPIHKSVSVLIFDMRTTILDNTTQSKNKTKSFFAQTPNIQKKLKIGGINNKYEMEADNVADQLIGMSKQKVKQEPQISLAQRKCSCCEEGAPQLQPLRKQITPLIQTKTNASDQVATDSVSNGIQSAKGGSHSIDSVTQSLMENSFGIDFSNVTIHNNHAAAQLNQQLNARAFTVGNDIFFDKSEYQPSSNRGMHLLAHELTHTIQQNPQQIIQKQTGTSCNTTLTTQEISVREEVRNYFFRNWQSPINEGLQSNAQDTLCNFSLNQLGLMKDRGLQFWMQGSIPDHFNGRQIEISGHGGLASYIKGIRTIFVQNGTTISQLTHEMAHAWDHLQRLRGVNEQSLYDFSGDVLERRINHSESLNSLTETDRRHTIEAGSSIIRITFEEMLNLYGARLPRTEFSFHASARDGYSRTDVREFYAEGYAVFHGGEGWLLQQARLFRYAVELYYFLLQEAQRENLPIPNITDVQNEARQLPRPR